MVSFILTVLQNAPAGFGFSDIGEWLQDVPHLDTLAEIEPIFFEDLSKNELLALVMLIKHRYLKQGPAHNLFDDYFQHFCERNKIADEYTELVLYQDKSTRLDLSVLQRTLTKLSLSNSNQLEHIILSSDNHLESITLSYLTKLVNIEHITSSPLKYLLINHCPSISDFGFIRDFNQLLWLDLSDNPQLHSLDFLTSSSHIVMLQLLNIGLLNHNDVWQQLKIMPHLKSLTIDGTQKQLEALRHHLPHCMVNGMTAYRKINSQ